MCVTRLECLDNFWWQRLSVESGDVFEALEGLLHASLAEEPAGALRHAEVEARHQNIGHCDNQQEQSPVACPDRHPRHCDAS